MPQITLELTDTEARARAAVLDSLSDDMRVRASIMPMEGTPR